MEEHRPGGHGGGGEEGGEGAEGVEEEETFADEGEGGDGDGEAGEGRAEGEGEGGEGEEVDVCLECVLHAFLDPVVSDARTSGGGGRTRNLSLPLLLSTTLASTCSASIGSAGGEPFGGERSPGEGGEGDSGGCPSSHAASSAAAEPMLSFIACRACASPSSWRGVHHGFGGADDVERGGDGRCDIAWDENGESKKSEQTTTTGRVWLFRVSLYPTEVTSLPLFIPPLCSSLHPTSVSYILTMPAPPTRTTSPASSSTSKPIFPADQLRAWIRPLLATTLRDVVYDHADPGRMKELSRGLSEVCALSCPLFA